MDGGEWVSEGEGAACALAVGLAGASVRPAVGCCQSCRALSGAVEVCCQAVGPGLSVQWDARVAPTVWPSARSLEITRDHPRSPKITRDHPRSPEITRVTRERVLRLHPDTRSASTAWHMRESTTPQAALWSSPSSHARSSPPPLTPAGRGRGAFGQADQRRWPGGGGGEVKAARWVDLSHRCSRLGSVYSTGAPADSDAVAVEGEPTRVVFLFCEVVRCARAPLGRVEGAPPPLAPGQRGLGEVGALREGERPRCVRGGSVGRRGPGCSEKKQTSRLSLTSSKMRPPKMAAPKLGHQSQGGLAPHACACVCGEGGSRGHG